MTIFGFHEKKYLRKFRNKKISERSKKVVSFCYCKKLRDSKLIDEISDTSEFWDFRERNWKDKLISNERDNVIFPNNPPTGYNHCHRIAIC